MGEIKVWETGRSPQRQVRVSDLKNRGNAIFCGVFFCLFRDFLFYFELINLRHICRTNMKISLIQVQRYVV